jgi:hypothetical protein
MDDRKLNISGQSHPKINQVQRRRFLGFVAFVNFGFVFLGKEAFFASFCEFKTF